MEQVDIERELIEAIDALTDEERKELLNHIRNEE